MDMVYLMLNEKGQTEPVQMVNASGMPQLLDANDPLVARLNTGPGSGRPLRLPKERDEFVEAVEFTEYHYFIDENNKVIPIPPGSIVHGVFEDEENLDGNMDHVVQENDQLRNDLVQVSNEITGEIELPAEKCEVHLEEEVVPCSGEEQELTGGSEPAETKLAEVLAVTSYDDFGVQEHADAATVDETGELHMENSSEAIFTQDEIELEEEVVSLQISEPELVTIKPSIKYSKRAAIFTSLNDHSGGIGRNTDAGFVGDMQTKSPLKKSKKKLVSVGGTIELQAAAAVEKIPLQSGKKNLHHPVELHATPDATKPSVTETGRPKRSVPRRSALEMLHGEGKSRKLHTSSGSDSEMDVGSATQYSGKRRQYKGTEKKALAAEKLTKSPLLSNEAQFILTTPDLSIVNADQKCDESLEIISNCTSPISAKRGKGRPRKLVPESPKIAETSQLASAVQKVLGSTSTTENKDESEHLVTVAPESEHLVTVAPESEHLVSVAPESEHLVSVAAEKESSKVEPVVTSEVDVVPKSSEFSALNSNDCTEPAFINVPEPDGLEIKAECVEPGGMEMKAECVEPGGMEIKAEFVEPGGIEIKAECVEPGGLEIKAECVEVVKSDTVDKAETSAGTRQKPIKRGRGRQKSMGVKKVSGFENSENGEETGRLLVEREASIVKDIRQMEMDISVDPTSEYSLLSPGPDVEKSNLDGELRSGQVAEDEVQEPRIVAEDLGKKEEQLATFECGISTHERKEESAENLLKEDCENVRDMCDDSTGGHTICKVVEDGQLVNGSKTEEFMMQDKEEEHLVVDEVMMTESEVAEERLVESDVHSANGKLENDTCQLPETDETTVEGEIYDAKWEDSSYLVESQPGNLIDPTIEMPEELSSNENLDFKNEQAHVGIDMNEEARYAEDVLCSNEMHHAPVEEQGGADLGHQVHNNEDIQDYDHESTGEPETAANLHSDIESNGEKRSVDRMQVNSQLTKSLLKGLQGAHEHGKKTEMEPAFKKFEEGVWGLDSKATLLVAADLEHFAAKLRCRLADRETIEDRKDSVINLLPLPPEERVRKFVVVEGMKLRALDQELDERHRQLMVMRGQLNRSESDLKQREQRLERSHMLLDLEKEALEKDRRKLLKERELIQKQRKLSAKLRENKKRKAETETETGPSTSSKKLCVSDPIPIKERRPLFEEMTAIKETKTLTNSLQALDKCSSRENLSLSLPKQSPSSADECESKDSVKIDIQRFTEIPVEKSYSKANMEAGGKSCVQRSDIHLTPSGVKVKQELRRRFEADELNSPGDVEQRLNKSLSHEPAEDDTKPRKLSSHTFTAGGQKPNKLSSYKSATTDQRKQKKSSLHKPKADEQKPRKSSHKPTPDEQKPQKTSHKPTADEQKLRKSSSPKPLILDMASSTASKSLVKKSGQPSKKHKKSPASLSSFCVLNQSESLKRKNTSSITSSCTGTNSTSSVSPNHSDIAHKKDLPSSPHAKKQHFGGIDVQEATESSSKFGQRHDVKQRLSTPSDRSSKKKDNKKSKRISAV